MNTHSRAVFPHRKMLPLALALLLTLTPGGRTEPTKPDPSAARQYVERTGDDLLKYFADDIEESYPFGRSSKQRDEEVAKSGTEAVSTDWKLSNKHFMFDGDWFAVQWFYSATTIKTGGKQVESTLAFGKVRDGKLVVWAEYFDDVVGELEQEGKLPLYAPDEMPFPWPAKATLKRPYRP